MREVIDDVVRTSPAISPEEISKVVISAIESVLPTAIRKVRLPKTPSPMYLGKKEYELKRRTKRSRELVRGQLTEHDVFMSEIASLQWALDGTASTVASQFEPQVTSNVPVPNIQSLFGITRDYQTEKATTPEQDEFPRQPHIEVDLLPRRQPNIHKNLETNILDAVTSELPAETIPKEKLLRFSVGPELQARLPLEKNMVDFVATVETAVRKFALGWKLTWDFDFELHTDIEEPEWSKMVLRIHPSNMEFELSMKIWQRIDTAVRTALISAKERTKDDDFRIMDDLNRNFFVELDLH